jgi:hypothetical protein
MLEQDEALATWQLAVPPELVAAIPNGVQGSGRTGQGPIAAEGVPARRLADHRKAYLDYEGPVSGDRGEVHIVDSGTYVLLAAGDTEWCVEFAGRVLRGRFRLVWRGPDAADWRLMPA